MPATIQTSEKMTYDLKISHKNREVCQVLCNRKGECEGS